MKMQRIASLALGLTLACSAQLALAAEGPMDFLFGSAGQVPKNQGVWKFGEYSAIRLVARESAASPNAHAAVVDAETLGRLLGNVTFDSGGGKFIALFSRSELEGLSAGLAEALAQARPDQDLLLAASARREGGMLSIAQTVTARLFVSHGGLQLIVHDARSDLLGSFRSHHMTPQLEFGKRQAASAVKLQSSFGMLHRHDWVQLPLRAAIGAKPMAASQPAPAPSTRQGTAFYSEQASRLQGLKLLREQELLSEEEFQRKRREIIDGL
jgi:hypothetical protein